MFRSIISLFVVFSVLLGFVSVNSRFDKIEHELEKNKTDNKSENIESSAPSEDASTFSLVWAEDFQNCELYLAENDETHKKLYYTDNHSCAFVSYGINSHADLYTTGVDENTVLHFRINNEENYEKTSLKVAYDFSGVLNKEKLSLLQNEFIALSFSFEHSLSVDEDITQEGDVYFRYTVSSENGRDLSVVSNSLKYSQNSIGGYEGGAYDPVTIVALIHVDERIDYSDLYFYIENFGQCVVFEDFLKFDSAYISSFEMCFDNIGTWSSYYFDDFELYSFEKGYDGSITDVLKEIKFI